MAHVVDTRFAGGEFVVLGDALTLPTSNNAASMPSQGSLRFNPDSGAIEVYLPSVQTWSALATGGGSSGGLLFNPLTQDYQLTGNLTINGILNVQGSVFGPYFSGTAEYARQLGAGNNTDGGTTGGSGGSGPLPFDISTFYVTAGPAGSPGAAPASRSLAVRFGEWLNLKDFRAVGDDVADDTQAVADWWTALTRPGSTLPGLVPAGVYKISAQMIWDLLSRRAGVTIIGTGVASSVFDLSTVSTTPAMRLMCSQGASTGNRISGIGFKGNLGGTLLQIGSSGFTDPMSASTFDIAVTNANAGPLSKAMVVNDVRGSALTVSAFCNQHGTALQLNRTNDCDILVNLGNADIGLSLSGDSSTGNTFRAPSIANTAVCVAIDSSGAANNTFVGGQFAWTANAINATAGSSNVFFNVSTAGRPASGLLANGIGVIVTNGLASNSAIIQALGGAPVNKAGDVMTGDLILANAAGLRFQSTAGFITPRLGLDAANTLSLQTDDGAGHPHTIFSVPQGNSATFSFAVPVAASLRGNADTATQLFTPITLTLSGDVSGSAVLANGAASPVLRTTLAPPSGSIVATYNQVSIEQSGRVISGTFIPVPNAITLAGAITGTGVVNGTVVTTLANSGVTPATYAVVTVDATGRVTGGQVVTNSVAGWLRPMTLTVTGDASGSVAFDGTVASTLAVQLVNTVVAPGTYSQVVVDGTGRVVNGVSSISNLSVIDCGSF